MTPILIGVAMVGVFYIGSRMSGPTRADRKSRAADGGGDGSVSSSSDGGSDGCGGDGGGGCD